MKTLDNAHALTIGISGYPHLTKLPVVQDAQDIHKVLHDPSICAYPTEDAEPPLLEALATKAAIVGALERLAARTNRRSTVFIYYSGHGMRDRRGTGYLMPYDSDDASDALLQQTAISGPELSTLLSAIPARRLTVVLDCCRASAVAMSKDVGRRASLPTDDLVALASGQGRAVFAASRDDGFAWVLPGAKNGVFTGHLLDGLKGAANGAGGLIRVCDLFHYVQQKVAKEPNAQRPVFDATLEENYPVALYRGGAAPALELPPPPEDKPYSYDAFVTYRRDDPTDKQWVERVLVPRLENAKLRVCLEHRDFRIGESRLKEMERAVLGSRYTIGVYSPAYVTGSFQNFQQNIARYMSTEAVTRRFLPIQRRPCELTLTDRSESILDVTDDTEVAAQLDRLVVQLREAPSTGLRS